MIVLAEPRRVSVAGIDLGDSPTISSLREALNSPLERQFQKTGEANGIPFDRTKSVFDGRGLSAISESDSGELVSLIVTFNRRERLGAIVQEEPEALFSGSVRLGEFTLAPHVSYSAYEQLVSVDFDCPSIHVCPGDHGDIASVAIGFEETPWG
ncbi:hypothetical protein ACFQY0_20980 [Haloferula chungangensis]|uniref:Uncharacterized protein n=1 Tax=Haloferula chungangensis TaxID=1048331 RepID=A0ABW2LB58_9BACT